MTRWIRIVLAVLATFIGITAIAGGIALIIGAATATSGGAVPDAAYLGGSPFTSYIIPGLVLAVVVGGTHQLAALLVGPRARGGPPAAGAHDFRACSKH